MKRIGKNANKILAVSLALFLCLGLFVHPSFGWEWGPSTTLQNILEAPAAYNASKGNLLNMANYVTGSSYVFCNVHWDNGSLREIYIIVTEDSEIQINNNRCYLKDPSAVKHELYWSFNDTNRSITEVTSDTTPTLINGIAWYQCNLSQYWYVDRDSRFYFNDEIYINGNVQTQPNLDISSYQPEPYPMIVEASKSSQYGGTYLSLRVRSIDVDNLISFGIDYTSSLGSYTAYVFYDDLNLYPGDDYDLFLMNPNYISSAEFTVTGVTFYGVNGDVSETGLSLLFNEDAYTYDPVNLTYTYFNQFTEVSYNVGIGVPYFDQALYFYTDGVAAAYFWDSSENLVQPFKFSVMAFPSFSSSYPYAFYLNDLPSYVELSAGLSDVLLLNVSESCFDRLYGAGSYLNFGNLLGQAYPDTELMTEMLNNWYASHNIQFQPLPFSESYNPNYSESATVYLTSSFFFRQVNYSLGDTADILNEFSVRFFQQDGFSHNLFQSLNDIGSNEDSFFKDAIMYLSNINYSLNDLKFNDTLQDITELLQSVNQGLSTLNSLDGSLGALVEDSSDSLQLLGSSGQSLADLLINSGSVLSLLTDGNGDISAILQWLEDSSVVTSFDMDLPSFDFGGIVSTFGGNMDSFGDWVNELVLVLPDLDYSDFDDWFTNAGNLLTGIDADSNFLGHLGDPYDYSDSGVNYLGWD